MITAIAAVSGNWGIGKDGDLLFHLPEDMKFFRTMTRDKVVVMGTNTLLSFPGGRPLKNRIMNIVLSDVDLPSQEGLTVCRSLDELRTEIAKYDTNDVFIIGGGMMYRQFCDNCDTAYITYVDADGDATVFFPNLDQKENWGLENESDLIESNGYRITFRTYKNNSASAL